MLNDLPADRVLLFQYGSNMSEERLTAKIWEHRTRASAGADLGVQLLGAARLTGWRFVFDLYSARQGCLVGDIVEGEERDEVWGALYDLNRELVSRSDGRRSVLDRIEGHRTEVDPENYRPITVTVELDADLREAHTYVGGEDARRRCRLEHAEAKPGRDYLRAILDGAHSVGLPRRYVRALATTIEVQGRGGPP